MITLKQLKWDNCFSYGSNNELDLSDNTVTQIIGTNGMGKSSIPLIIEEILYNKNSKGIKKADIPNRYINNGYSIFLSFEKDGSEYEISVDRKSSIKVRLEKDGEDISSHTATNTYKTIQSFRSSIQSIIVLFILTVQIFYLTNKSYPIHSFTKGLIISAI